MHSPDSRLLFSCCSETQPSPLKSTTVLPTCGRTMLPLQISLFSSFNAAMYEVSRCSWKERPKISQHHFNLRTQKSESKPHPASFHNTILFTVTITVTSIVFACYEAQTTTEKAITDRKRRSSSLQTRRGRASARKVERWLLSIHRAGG